MSDPGRQRPDGAAAFARFETDLFVPLYRPLRSGRWEIRIAAAGLATGYWSGPALVETMPTLLRDGELWMSVTPLEVESQQIGIRAASGHVLVLGLGLGWAAAAAACREAVEAVTVVERDPEVIALYRALDVAGWLPDAARAKIRIVQGDALAHRPDAPVDILLADIWLTLDHPPEARDDRLAEVARMQRNVGAGAIYFWGQELAIARRAAAAGRTLDADGIAPILAECGLPLIGPDLPSYAEIVGTAARRWLRDRPAAGAPISSSPRGR